MKTWLTKKKLIGLLCAISLSIMVIALTRRCNKEEYTMPLPIEETIAKCVCEESFMYAVR